MKSMYICVKNQFEMVHCWPEAPTNMYYLRTPHRHVMHITTHIEVSHNDRELEIIDVKHSIDYFLHNTHFELTTSCEMLAERIIEYVHGQYGDRDVQVTVLEDGENGATVRYFKEKNLNEEN